MPAKLADLRPVRVVGIGLQPYSFPTGASYVELGVAAARIALADAGLIWEAVDSAIVGTASSGMGAGRAVTRHLGSTGLSVAVIENASASGSTAFRLACLEVASGISDIAIALGVDTYGGSVRRAADEDGIPRLAPAATLPVLEFALLADSYMRTYGIAPEALGSVAVKNHGNAARNPNAQFRKPRSLDQVMASQIVAGPLTALQCCPRGEGAAAVIVASDEAIGRHRLRKDRAVLVAASVSTSDIPVPEAWRAPIELTRRAVALALADCGICPDALELIELHDAFSVEELAYTEAMGLCGPGEGAALLASGDTAIGGRCAVNASGGLIGMGHPLGPTGVGQIAELTLQLRGEAAGRQHPARTGLAHMIGLGQVALVHVLRAPE